MKEIATVELSKDQVPKDLSQLQDILKKEGLDGVYQIKNESLYINLLTGKLELSLFQHDPSLTVNTGYGIDIAGQGDIYQLGEVIIDLKELFESKYEGCVFSSEYLEEEEVSSILLAQDAYFHDLEKLNLKSIAIITIDCTTLNPNKLFKKLSDVGFGESYKVINGNLAIDTGYGDVYQFIISIKNNQTLIEIKIDSVDIGEAIVDIEEALLDAFPNSRLKKIE